MYDAILSGTEADGRRDSTATSDFSNKSLTIRLHESAEKIGDETG